MHHEITLITTIAAALGLALVLGFIAARLKLPALVGYLAAGIVLGPFTPGFVADGALAAQLAEIGVMLLMFGVGLHFSLDDLMAVKRVAVPGAVVQMAAATALGAALATAWGWGLGAALVFGLAMLGGTDSSAPDARGLWTTLGITLAQVAAFVALMLVVGRRLFPWLLWQVARTGSRELFTLCVVAAAVTIAYGAAGLFGVSFALGAFFAGMVLRESEFSHRAAEESLPLRDAFAVLFFVSVGMLFDPLVLVERPLQVLSVVAIIVVGKSIAAFALVLLLRYPLNTAMTVSASLAQIGEFSFILAALGLSLKLLPPEAQSLIVAGALISIAINPLLFSLAEPAQRWILARSAAAQRHAQRDDPLAELPPSTEARYLARQVVLVGHGRVGRRLAGALREQGIACVVVERNRERVEALRAQGLPAVIGDAADPAVLIQAHIAQAAMLLIATADAVGVRQMIDTARTLNPQVKVAVRTHSDEEAQWLAGEGARTFEGEDELAQAMLRHVLGTMQARAA